MKKLIDNTFEFTYKFVLIFSIICFSIALIGATFFCVNRSYNYLNPIVLIVGTIIFLFLVNKLYKTINKLNEKQIKIICCILLVLQFIFLFISTRLIRSIPQVDLIHILTGINSLNDIDSLSNIEYFSVYPNNRFLLMLIYWISKIPLNGGNVITYLFSSACVTTMSLFVYKTVKQLTDSKKALMSLILCVFSPIFYLYVSYYYTDIIMLPFASILTYLLVKNNLKEDNSNNIFINCLIGMIGAIGYKIRAVSIFLLIAYFVYLILKKNFKQLIKNLIPILVSLLLVISVINNIENKFFDKADKNKEFPLTHWIMMGVNLEKNGYYSQDDYDLSFNTADKAERTSLNIKKIGERLKKQGVVGNASLLAQKVVTVWGKGDYSYQKYLGLVDDYSYSYNNLIEDKNVVINYVLQIFNISILILSIISLIILYKKKEISLIAIALFGAALFYVIWEVCPRYGLSFLPWLIILSTQSYDKIGGITEKIVDSKWIKYIIIFVTIILLSFGFYKYVIPNYKETVATKDTSKKIKYISINNQNSIKQSLIVKKDFNRIKLRFDNKNDNLHEYIYILELIDENEIVKYKKEFTINDVKIDKYTVFKLDKNYTKGKYYIKLSTNSPESLDVALSYKEYFDFYPQGKLTINDDLQTGDLMFEVIKREKRSTYNYFEYGILIVLIMYLEFILFVKKEEL